MGPGDDTFVSGPSPGRDVVEGEDGVDTLQVVGSAADDVFAAASASGRLALAHNGVEAVSGGGLETALLAPGAGADSLTVSSLAGTAVTGVQADLAADGVPDSVIVNGTAGADAIQVAAAGGGVRISGVAPPIDVLGSQAGSDRVIVNGLGGNDTLSALTTLVQTTLSGGDGNDSLAGSAGADALLGGAGADTADGNGGSDSASLGAGNDTFVWDPGDGSDVVEGEGDQDMLLFNGSAAAEVMAASANGGRLRFTRNLGNIEMDTDGIETLAVNALGGADALTVGSLAGTDVATANIELGVSGAGDAAADLVTVEGTTAGDVIQATAVGGAVQVTTLAAALTVNVTRSEAANDRLTVNGLGGNDTISGGALAALMALTVDGGEGNDTINGGNGADTLIAGTGNDTVDGNQGNDTAFQGDGNDTFVWDPGDGSDIVEGQSGVDTLLFNGSAGAEIFAASANGGRLLFTRNVGNIVMDTDDVEILTVNALGGTDTPTINSLAATDVTTVNLNLGVSGAGDGAADAVTVNGTVGADLFGLSGSAGSVSVDGSEVNVFISNSEPANDTLTINTSSGDDIVGASSLANTSTQLTLNGGNDQDILSGSQGNDTINGEAGDDTLFGNAGNDTFTGGAGTDSATGGAGADVDGGGLETFTQ